MPFERLIRRSGIAGCAFLVFAWLTTQVPDLRAVVPFTDDPYDAVTSFAIIAIGIVGGATVVRWLAQARRAPDAGVERRIALGGSVVTGSAAIALGADVIALVVVGVASPGLPALMALALLAATVVAVAVALVALWTARTDLVVRPLRADQEPDLIDDVVTIVRSFGARGPASRLTSWAETSRFSPRRHRLVVGVLAAGLASVGAVVWHALREGAWASPAAAAFFGSLVALGVVGAYLVGLEPLRLIRPADISSRTSSQPER